MPGPPSSTTSGSGSSSTTSPGAGDERRRRELLRRLRTTALFHTQNGVSMVGDALELLKQLPSESVDLVLTSPPYDGQPKYGDGESYDRDWYEGYFLDVSKEVLRLLRPRGSFVLNYRSKRAGSERGTLQYEIVLALRRQGFLFCEDFVWGKPSPPPGRFRRFLKDAVEYCFQFSKGSDWQFFPEQCLAPARWDAKDRARRRALPQNYLRVDEPSGQGRRRALAGPDMVRPSTLLLVEPEFARNPTEHPARFPVEIPEFFLRLLTRPGDLVLDPFAGTGTTAVAAEQLGRRWVLCEAEASYARAIASRLK